MASLPDMAQLLTRCQEDSFHEVKKAGCTAIAALAAKAGPAMEPHAERMLQVGVMRVLLYIWGRVWQ